MSQFGGIIVLYDSVSSPKNEWSGDWREPMMSSIISILVVDASMNVRRKFQLQEES